MSQSSPNDASATALNEILPGTIERFVSWPDRIQLECAVHPAAAPSQSSSAAE
jgi:hypothetical protein